MFVKVLLKAGGDWFLLRIPYIFLKKSEVMGGWGLISRGTRLLLELVCQIISLSLFATCSPFLNKN